MRRSDASIAIHPTLRAVLVALEHRARREHGPCRRPPRATARRSAYVPSRPLAAVSAASARDLAGSEEWKMPALPRSPEQATTGAQVISRAALDALLATLASDYRLLGPTVRDEAIVYGDIRATGDLPEGYSERQEAAHYRLVRRSDRALFGFTVGPESLKRSLHPPLQPLFSARREAGELAFEAAEQAPARKLAFIGARACDLAAMSIQDRVFLGGPSRDRAYQARRQDAFIVAVNCSQSAATCFCASMGSGPELTRGFDLALTELLDDSRHEFLVEIGSAAGAGRLAQVPSRAASSCDLATAHAISRQVRDRMQRALDTRGIKELLQSRLTDPRWAETGQRCLSCGNCTMVCPTCFCTSIGDRTDLAGRHAERVRKWDSCFTLDFSYLHGGSVRRSSGARYRHWLTHKLAGWIDQFGSSGCVGCGRCISWCPAGIDITEEVAVLRSRAGAAEAPHERS
jgi:ferredoxin